MGTPQSRGVESLFRQQLSVTVNQMNVDSERSGPNQDHPSV